MGWKLDENFCESCEPGDNCEDHHQSPVNLDRNWGARKHLGDIGVMNCGDNHWMKYESGTCTWEHLKAANAITGTFQRQFCLLYVLRLPDDFLFFC
jgi:hypothetical protein